MTLMTAIKDALALTRSQRLMEATQRIQESFSQGRQKPAQASKPFVSAKICKQGRTAIGRSHSDSAEFEKDSVGKRSTQAVPHGTRNYRRRSIPESVLFM